MFNKYKHLFNSNESLVFLGTLFLFLYLITKGISYPFVGYNAWNFNIYSLIAHNYNQWGILSINFSPIIDVSKDLPGSPELYINHPPLITILQSFIYRLLGETFMTSRVLYILSGVLSLYMIYKLSFLLSSKKSLALFSILVYSIIPATSIFGRMIGQESVLLFFLLGFSYFIYKFIYDNKSYYFAFSVVFITLAFLTDWPSYYFIFIFIISLIYIKKYKLSLLLSSITVASLLVYLYWVYSLTNNVEFLLNAFITRSTGENVVNIYYFTNFLFTIVFRSLVYFNPFIIVSSILGYLMILKVRKGISDYFMFVTIFLCFGVVHIALYPYGSTGHPYWIYYLSVFICLSAGYFLSERVKSKIVILIFIVFSITYSLVLVEWKNREILGNLYRYELASILPYHIVPFSSVMLGQENQIDHDLLNYVFKYKTFEYVEDDIKNVDYIIYSCILDCQSKSINDYNRIYASYTYKNDDLKLIIFDTHKASVDSSENELRIYLPKSRESIFKRVYNWFVTNSLAPQL